MDQKEYGRLTESEKKKEDWMNSKWRPMMGWIYMGTCAFDFIIAPILWSIVQTLGHGQVNMQWQPLTLQGAGLYHIAMGAVLGIAAYGRTQEKLNGANNGGLQLPANAGTTYTPPPPVAGNNMGGMGNNMGGGFGAPTQTTVTQTFGTPAPASSGFGGGFGSTPAPAANNGFGSTSAPATASSGFGSGFGSTDTSNTGSTDPITYINGKKAPVQPDFPEL